MENEKNKMGMQIKVSVIMPLYNDAKYLEATLESVLSQTLREIEIIVVDDGSTDGSVEIVRGLMKEDERLRLFCHEKNQGGGAARNTGMAYASGDYLSFLDSDDYFYPEMLEKAYNRAAEMSADICAYGVKYAEGGTPEINFNRKYLPRKNVFSSEDIPGPLFNLFNSIPWNKLFRRKFVEGTGIRWSETFCSNDVLFVNGHMAMAKRITAVDEVLVRYENRTEDNAQSKYTWYFKDAMGTYIALKELLERAYLYGGRIRQSYLHRLCGALSWQFGSIQSEEKKSEYFDWLLAEGFERLGLSGISREDVWIDDRRSARQYRDLQRMMAFSVGQYREYAQAMK